MSIFHVFPCDTAYLPCQAQLVVGQHRGLPLPGRWDILLGRSSELLAIMSGRGGVPVGKVVVPTPSLHIHWSALLIAMFPNNAGTNNDLLGLKWHI